MDDLKQFEEILRRYNGNDYEAYINTPMELKRRLQAKFPYTFPILVSTHTSGNRGYKTKQYYIRVWKYTLQHELPYDKDTEVIDHIIPINLGYRLHIDPQIIGGINNLRIIKKTDNLRKNDTLTIEGVRLLQRHGYLVPKDCTGHRSKYVVNKYRKMTRAT